MRLPSGGLPEGEDFLDNESREFYTLKGYRLQNGGDITEAMEDYLEMICRHHPGKRVYTDPFFWLNSFMFGPPPPPKWWESCGRWGWWNSKNTV